MNNLIKNTLFFVQLLCIIPFAVPMNEVQYKKRCLTNAKEPNKKRLCESNEEREHQAFELVNTYQSTQESTALELKRAQIKKRNDKAFLSNLLYDMTHNVTLSNKKTVFENKRLQLFDYFFHKSIQMLKKSFYNPTTNELYTIIPPQEGDAYFDLAYSAYKHETLNNNKLVLIFVKIKDFFSKMALDFNFCKKETFHNHDNETKKIKNHPSNDDLAAKRKFFKKKIQTLIKTHLEKKITDTHYFEESVLRHYYLQDPELNAYYRDDNEGPAGIYYHNKRILLPHKPLDAECNLYMAKKQALFSHYFFNDPIAFEYTLDLTDAEKDDYLDIYSLATTQLLYEIEDRAKSTHAYDFNKLEAQCLLYGKCFAILLTITCLAITKSTLVDLIFYKKSTRESLENNPLVNAITLVGALAAICIIGKLRIDGFKKRTKKASLC